MANNVERQRRRLVERNKERRMKLLPEEPPRPPILQQKAPERTQPSHNPHNKPWCTPSLEQTSIKASNAFSKNINARMYDMIYGRNRHVDNPVTDLPETAPQISSSGQSLQSTNSKSILTPTIPVSSKRVNMIKEVKRDRRSKRQISLRSISMPPSRIILPMHSSSPSRIIPPKRSSSLLRDRLAMAKSYEMSRTRSAFTRSTSVSCSSLTSLTSKNSNTYASPETRDKPENHDQNLCKPRNLHRCTPINNFKNYHYKSTASREWESPEQQRQQNRQNRMQEKLRKRLPVKVSLSKVSPALE